MYLTLKDSANRIRFRGLVQAPDFASDGNGMLLLSLVGPQTALLAVHANIVKHRPERTLVATQVMLRKGAEQFTVRTVPGNKYHISAMPEVDGQKTVIILRTDFSKLGGHRYILGGTEDEPSPWFESAMSNLPTLPYKTEWLPVLWKEAQKAKLIAVPCYMNQVGIGVWQVSAQEVQWQKLLKELILKGALS